MPIVSLIAAAIPIVGGMVIRMVAPGLLKELGKKFLTRATAAQVRNAGKNIPTANRSQVLSQSRVNIAKSEGKLPGRMKDQASGKRSQTTPSLRKSTTSRSEKIRRADPDYRVGQEPPLTGKLQFPRTHPGKVSSSDKASINPELAIARGSGRKVSQRGLYRKSGGSIKPKQYAYGGRVAKYKG